MAKKKTDAVVEKVGDILTLRPWVYLQSLGDGSATALLFNTEKEAEAYAEHDDERLCDDVFRDTIKVNLKTGKLLDVPVREEDDDDEDEEDEKEGDL